MTQPPRWDESLRARTPRRWGVDSQKRANLPVTWNSQPMTFFDYVVERIGRAPDFWGRFIGSGAGAHADNRFDGNEVQFLHDRDCRVGLIYNGHRMLPAQRVPYGPNRRRHLHGSDNGRWTAKNAISHANRLNPPAPTGTRIYADIEDWNVDWDWIHGWQEIMRGSRFAGEGGLYGRTGHTSTNQAFHRRVGNPQFNAPNALNPSQWTRQIRPSHWSRAAEYAGLADDTAQAASIAAFNFAAFQKFSRYAWSNDPRRQGDPQTVDELFPRSFSATDVPGGTESTVWQYRMQCYIDRGGGGPIDLNYAQEAAFSEMW